MSHYFKDLIIKLRNPCKESGKEHHLFLLGTAVDYVDRPTDPNISKSYIRGETFSYTAQLMSLLLGEHDSTIKYADAHLPKSPYYAHAYHSNSVDVINGADTPGYEVGDRLAKALMLALAAVAEGKTQLSISGFSRGGVESIVLTHELARVRDALAKDLSIEKPRDRRSLATLIQESNSVPGLALVKDPSYTRQVLTELVTSEPLDDEQELKLKLLNNLNALQVKLFVLDPVPGGNFGKLIRLGWQEECFYTLPEFVVQRQEFVQKHETSNCFKPIIPLGMPYEVIPGCHGTGDGNQFDHNGSPVPESLKHNSDLSGVQDLVLRRWIDFMFPNEIKMDTAIDLGHPELDSVTNAYLPANSSERASQLLSNYQHIQDNYPAFEWLATRNYTGLGRYMAHRQVHFRQRGNTPITDLDVHGDGTIFLNLQHVKLWMANTLKLSNFFELNLVEQVKWLKDNIEYAFKPVDLIQPITDQNHMISRLLMEEKNHTLVQESLSYLVNTVTQTYLRNHLSIEERIQCRNCVANTFDTLKEAATATSGIDPNRTKLASTFMEVIRKDLTSTILQHQQALLSMAYTLSRDAEDLRKTLESTDKFDTTDGTPISWLMDTQKLVEDLDLLIEQINALEPWYDQKKLVDHWSRDLPILGENAEEICFDKSKEHIFHIISQQQVILLTNASTILSKMPEALANKPEQLDSKFYSYIHKLANVDRLEQTVQTTQMKLEQISLELDSTRKQQESTQHQLEQIISETENAKEKEVARLTSLLDAYQSKEERDAIVAIDSLLKITTQYFNHLNQSKDNSALFNTKNQAVTELINCLKETHKLPSEQLVLFNNKLKETQDKIQEHRDPLWQRFFRDCVRIIGLLFSGVGLYRIVTGQAPQFFKPSHGEQFIEAISEQNNVIPTTMSK